MGDPVKKALARQHEAEAQQRKVREVAQGVHVALQMIDASEHMRVDRMRHADEENPGVTLVVHGVGNPREYELTLPLSWIDEIHTALHAPPADEPEAVEA